MNKKRNDKIEKLKKQKLIISILTIILWIVSFYIEAFGLAVTIPIAEIILFLLNVDYIIRDIVISLMEFFLRILPLTVYISGKVLEFKKYIEIETLKNNPSLNIDVEEKINEEVTIIDELEILKVYDILDRFERLPRNKQMEVLNYIKGDLTIKDNELCQQIEELNKKYQDILQTECEDILFPDFDEQDKNYTKKRKK